MENPGRDTVVYEIADRVRTVLQRVVSGESRYLVVDTLADRALQSHDAVVVLLEFAFLDVLGWKRRHTRERELLVEAGFGRNLKVVYRRARRRREPSLGVHEI